jgi:hypothetical protein
LAATSFRCQASNVAGDNRGHFLQHLPSQSLGLSGQPPTLVVGEPQAALAELLPQHPVLLFEVIHRLQLALVHPPSHSDQNKSEWIHHPGHLVNLSPPRNQDLAIQLDQVFGPYG